MLTELILRLEAATMPRLDLDRDIFFVVVPAMEGLWEHLTEQQRRDVCPRYTESVDVAITLLPPYSAWSLWSAMAMFGAEVNVPSKTYSANGSTAAIALAIAALRAREAANV